MIRFVIIFHTNGRYRQEIAVFPAFRWRAGKRHDCQRVGWQGAGVILETQFGVTRCNAVRVRDGIEGRMW
jgi:hypothetical protein